MPTVEAEIRFTLPNTGWAPHAARRHIGRTLAVLDLPHCGELAGDLVEELVVNAQRFTGQAPTLRLLVGDAVRVEGADPDPTPVRFAETVEEIPLGAGIGLAVVADQSDRYGCDPVAAGKRVWFELDRARG